MFSVSMMLSLVDTLKISRHFLVSFLKIFRFCFSIMMAGQPSGTSLSGPRPLFISVQESKQNGESSSS